MLPIEENISCRLFFFKSANKIRMSYEKETLSKKQDERNFVKQILHQTEGTQPAADQPADQSPHKNEKSGYIKSQLKVPAPNDSLERADGTGSGGSGAGIAVKSRNAGVFPFSLI